MPQDEEQRRMVDRHQRPADPGLFLGLDRADDDPCQGGRQPPGPEAERLKAREEQAQGRVQGDGQDRGDGHGGVLREGEGLEQPSLLRLEGENRHEGDGDHQKGEEGRSAHLLTASTMTRR